MVDISGIQMNSKDIDISIVSFAIGGSVLIASIVYSNLYGYVISPILMFVVPIIIWIYRRQQRKRQAKEIDNTIWHIN